MNNLKRKVADFLTDLNNEKFEKKTFEAKISDLESNSGKTMMPVYEYVEEQINLGKLAIGEVKVEDVDAVIDLETNLINLPVAEPQRVSKMISDQDEMDLKVYLVISSPYGNQSGLRIDEAASADDCISDMKPQVDGMNECVEEKVNEFEHNLTEKAGD